MPAILAKKLGMTQRFLEDGRVERVTVLEAGPCPVTAIRTDDATATRPSSSRSAPCSEKHLTKAELGHLKKADAPPVRTLVEFRDEAGELHGRRHRHRRGVRGRADRSRSPASRRARASRARSSATTSAAGPKSHGSHNVRAPGSIGASATPSRVFKGIRGPGQMGDKRVTQRASRSSSSIPDQNLLLVRGSVPGPKGGTVEVRTDG